jgi:hypothetical protein
MNHLTLSLLMISWFKSTNKKLLKPQHYIFKIGISGNNLVSFYKTTAGIGEGQVSS